jgi:hypothetical protein
LDYYLERFLFPLRELDTPGCNYNIFLRNFPEPLLGDCSYRILSGAKYGSLAETRVRLDKTLDEIHSKL